jgi:hypothetical protein
MTLVVDSELLAVQAGKHTVWELTRGRVAEVTVVSTTRDISIVLSPSTLGAVAINETVVLKLALSPD